MWLFDAQTRLMGRWQCDAFRKYIRSPIVLLHMHNFNRSFKSGAGWLLMMAVFLPMHSSVISYITLHI